MSPRTTTESGPDHGRPFDTGWYVAAGLMLLILIGVIVVALPDGAQEVQAQPAAAASAQPSGPPAEPVADTPVTTGSDSRRTCPTTRVVTSGHLLAPPEGAVWEILDGVTLPTSRTAGPARREPLPACYSHDPEGALLAAASAPALLQGGDRTIVVDERFTAGPLRETVARGPRNTNTAQPVGFRFLSYDADRAVISVALRFRSGGYAQIPVQMVWSEGDWKFDGNPPGGELPGGSISTLDGFIRWAGV